MLRWLKRYHEVTFPILIWVALFWYTFLSTSWYPFCLSCRFQRDVRSSTIVKFLNFVKKNRFRQFFGRFLVSVNFSRPSNWQLKNLPPGPCATDIKAHINKTMMGNQGLQTLKHILVLSKKKKSYNSFVKQLFFDHLNYCL